MYVLNNGMNQKPIIPTQQTIVESKEVKNKIKQLSKSLGRDSGFSQALKHAKKRMSQ